MNRFCLFLLKCSVAFSPFNCPWSSFSFNLQITFPPTFVVSPMRTAFPLIVRQQIQPVLDGCVGKLPFVLSPVPPARKKNVQYTISKYLRGEEISSLGSLLDLFITKSMRVIVSMSGTWEWPPSHVCLLHRRVEKQSAAMVERKKCIISPSLFHHCAEKGGIWKWNLETSVCQQAPSFQSLIIALECLQCLH